MAMFSNDIMDMLRSIRQDGKTWLAAYETTVKYEGEGFTIYVEDEEYSWSKSMRETAKDVKELQDERPFPTGGYVNEGKI